MSRWSATSVAVAPSDWMSSSTTSVARASVDSVRAEWVPPVPGEWFVI
jgi:hypothetical protein